jgi:hypothetical protein
MSSWGRCWRLRCAVWLSARRSLPVAPYTEQAIRVYPAQQANKKAGMKHTMRIAILANVHANLPALTAVLADARQRGCERVYHAGDLIAAGPYPAEVVDLARANGMICVQGNHEAWVTTGLPPDP